MKKILVLIVIIGVFFTGCGFDCDVGGKLKSPNYDESNVKPLSDGKDGNVEEVYNEF